MLKHYIALDKSEKTKKSVKEKEKEECHCTNKY